MVLHHRPEEEDGGQEGAEWNGQYPLCVKIHISICTVCTSEAAFHVWRNATNWKNGQISFDDFLFSTEV